MERPSSESSSESSESESEESEEEEEEEEEEEDSDDDEDPLTGFFPGAVLLGGAALEVAFVGAPFSVFAGAGVGFGTAAQRSSDSSEPEYRWHTFGLSGRFLVLRRVIPVTLDVCGRGRALRNFLLFAFSIPIVFGIGGLLIWC